MFAFQRYTLKDAREARVNFGENRLLLQSEFLAVNREHVDNQLLQDVGYRKSSRKFQLLGERWQQAQVQPKGRLGA